jgi:hypothetical protein
MKDNFHEAFKCLFMNTKFMMREALKLKLYSTLKCEDPANITKIDQ